MASHSHGPATPDLIAAAEEGDAAEVEALLQAGADVHCVDSLGWTPLHEAAISNSDPAVCALLLRHRASVTAVNNYGETPLHMGAANESAAVNEICALLLQHGASPEEADSDHRTAMDIAEERGGLRPPAQQEALLTLLQMSPQRMRARAEGRAREQRERTDTWGPVGLLLVLFGPFAARMATVARAS